MSACSTEICGTVLRRTRKSDAASWAWCPATADDSDQLGTSLSVPTQSRCQQFKRPCGSFAASVYPRSILAYRNPRLPRKQLTGATRADQGRLPSRNAYASVSPSRSCMHRVDRRL
ncbi:hypothetical protein IG631_23584 [Alternaria alternata]|nr:hypothetical protein IG631_23584 [Alternaria alternata]